MENFLYRLGFASARRPALVLVAWFLVLVVGGAGALLFARGATSNYTVPGASFQQVSDRLQEVMPESGVTSGLLTLSTKDGAPLAEGQKMALAQARERALELESVASVSNPFEVQQQLDDLALQTEEGPGALAEAQAQLDAAWAALAEGEAQLNQAQEELNGSWAQLDEAKANLAPGVPDDMLAEVAPELFAQQEPLVSAQEALNASSQELQGTRDQLTGSQTELDTQKAALDQARLALELGAGLRFVNQAGNTALINISFTEDIYAMSAQKREEILSTFQALEAEGLTVTFSNEIVQDVSELAGASEIIGLVVALLVLVLTLASVIAAGLPVLVALLGCGIGVSIVYASTALFPMTSTDPVLALMLGLGVGIDYALLILHRFRQYLVQGETTLTAAGYANATAGHSVLFAGLTNIIALSALTITGIPFLGVMGLAGAFTVAIVVVVALTATPAVLALLGHRTLSAAQKQALAQGISLEESQAQKLERGNRGWGAFVTRHPLVMVLASLAVLGLATLPTSSLRLGLPDGSYQQEDSTAYKTYQTISEHFGEGRNSMIYALVEAPQATDEASLRIKALEVAQALKDEGIVSASVGSLNPDQRAALITLVPASGPNSQQTADTVHRLTDALPALQASSGTSIGLTGQAIANIDISERISRAVPLYLGLVLALCLVLMTIVFRSIWIPLMATVGFLMSTLASFGAVVAIYQWGWLAPLFDVTNPGAILAFLPILLVGILFGLSVDYQIFIVSGMRDAYKEGFSAKEAVRVGYRQGGAVVTACGIIMISVFAGFIYSHLTVVRPIGFALALGVAMDAFLVRTTFIPAAMYLLGEKAWWLPAPLAKVLGTVREAQKD